MDSRRIISADKDGLLCVWLADSATLLQTIQGPHKSLAVTNNMKFAVSDTGWMSVTHSYMTFINSNDPIVYLSNPSLHCRPAPTVTIRSAFGR